MTDEIEHEPMLGDKEFLLLKAVCCMMPMGLPLNSGVYGGPKTTRDQLTPAAKSLIDKGLILFSTVWLDSHGNTAPGLITTPKGHLIAKLMGADER